MTLNGSMNSLLKEIDNEMEYTATSDWRLPLQDIGDETMEMLVNHNTRENKHLHSDEPKSQTVADSETSSPSKKSVGFSDGVEYHEYARVSEGEKEFGHGRDSTDVETQWKRSLPKRQRALPAISAREESEEESEVEEEPELTIGELRQHSVTDMAEKLSNMLDSKENKRKLKEMAQEVDNYATQPEADSNRRGEQLHFALRSTQPLVPNATGNQAQSPQIVEFQTIGNSSLSEDEDENQLESIADSPPKIPLTNRISINNFNLDDVSRNATTRVSSGSSYAESGSDLETTTANDRYKLLEYKSDIPPELQHKPKNTDKFPHTPTKITAHSNVSNPYSLATEYESARETPNGSVSDLNSEVMDASVENLGISDGLKESSQSFDDTSVDSEEPQGDDTLREEDLGRKNPSLPELPVQVAPNSQAEEANEEANAETTEDYDQNHSYIDEDEEEYAGLHDFSSSYGSLHAGQEDETVDDNDEGPPQAEWSSLTEELNASVYPAGNSRVSSSGSQDSQRSSQSVRRANLESLPPLKARGSNIPPLVPTVESDPIFNEDSFQEIFDTSGDSLDLTRSVKPSDYISIWHSQADGMKPNSPVFSTNSQFSQRSVSTQSSTVSTGRNEFKFKSRIISRCRFYNPNDRVIIPSDSEDDEAIYVVDHAMDPRRRNTLISKQARNNIRQKKKLNPIRAAAASLQNQGFSTGESDSWPRENYPTTVVPSESFTIHPIPVEVEEHTVSIQMDEVEEEARPPAPDVYEFGSYEHLAALADLEGNHMNLTKSSSSKSNKSMRSSEEVKRENSLPASESLPTREITPLMVPPRSIDREKSIPILTPPPRSINRKANLPTLAPPPSVNKNEKPPILLTLAREKSELTNESFTNEFESPPEPLYKRKAARASSNGTHESQENTTISSNVSEKLDLSPCLQDKGLGDDFGIYLEKLNRDDQSIQQSVKIYEGSYNIWNQELNFAEDAARKASIPSEVLNRLLETESVVVEDLDENQSGNSDSSQRYIKTPTDDVFIGRGLSENGLEAIVSNGDASERASVLFDEFNNESLYKTPNHSPTRKTHVRSPFKPISPLRPTKSDMGKPAGTPVNLQDKLVPLTPKSTESKLDLEPNSDLRPTSSVGTKSTSTEGEEHEITKLSSIKPNIDVLQSQEEPSAQTQAEEKEPSEDVQFPDAGNLYLRLRNISGIYLRGVKRHRAQYSIEFDNGENIAQTPWQPVTDSGELKLSREFEVILDRNPKKRGKVVMTLKFRYDKIQYESKVEEIVEKVAIPSKKKLFGKRKEQYEYQKKYIEKPPKRDEWEFIFARDGSFGRCELVLDEDFLDHARFQCKTISLDLKNEWAREHGPPNKKPHQLPRRQPYIIGQLKIDTCYLVRSSALEKFPRTLSIAGEIMSKYKAQQSISMEGYLLQDGGDLTGNKARRYFKLQGNRLTGYHEVTRTAKIIINLLKVTKVVGHPTDDDVVPDVSEEDIAQGGFHLVFANGETIAFDTEFSTDEKYEWYRKVKRVVDLNRSHQPWVKAFYENSTFDNL